MTNIEELFNGFQENFEKEQEIKDVSRRLNQPPYTFKLFPENLANLEND